MKFSVGLCPGGWQNYKRVDIPCCIQSCLCECGAIVVSATHAWKPIITRAIVAWADWRNVVGLYIWRTPHPVKSVRSFHWLLAWSFQDFQSHFILPLSLFLSNLFYHYTYYSQIFKKAVILWLFQCVSILFSILKRIYMFLLIYFIIIFLN